MRDPDSPVPVTFRRKVTSFVRHFPSGRYEWGRLNRQKVTKGDKKGDNNLVFWVNNVEKGCILATFGAGFGRLLPAPPVTLGILSLFWPFWPKVSKRWPKGVQKSALEGPDGPSRYLR